MPFDQLPYSKAVPNLAVAGASIGSDPVTPIPQPRAMAVNVQVTNYADPLASGPLTIVVQTRKTGTSSWFSLDSSLDSQVAGNGSYGILIVDPIYDDVRAYFQVLGHTLDAKIDFLIDGAFA
jgi:hypothetical protein